jgi:acetylglutamate kinase
MVNLNLKPDEMAGAIASGALAAKRLMCTCGVQAVFALRKTPDGLHLYSLTF